MILRRMVSYVWEVCTLKHWTGLDSELRYFSLKAKTLAVFSVLWRKLFITFHHLNRIFYSDKRFSDCHISYETPSCLPLEPIHWRMRIFFLIRLHLHHKSPIRANDDSFNLSHSLSAGVEAEIILDNWKAL